jgi:aminoglycoside 2'-N-acetyltransferase I
MTPRLQIAHTADLDAASLKAARALLDLVFGDEMTDQDWDHALGGMHALVRADEAVIGHASVIQRRLLHGGRALRAGYVEGVAVHPEHREEGHGATVMRALERIIRAAYDLGALGSTEEAAGFYSQLGWRAWEGETWALTPDGRVRTPDDDGGVYVLETPSARLDLKADITCGWREGDVW